MDDALPQRKHPLGSSPDLRPSTRLRTSVYHAPGAYPATSAPSTSSLAPQINWQRPMQNMEPRPQYEFHLVNVKLKNKVSRLEAELLLERDWSKQAQLRTAQDMLFDLIREQEKHGETKRDLALEKSRREKDNQTSSKRFAEAELKAKDERDMRVRAQATAEAFRMDSEHLQILNTSLEADLNDLRAIEDEDTTRRTDEHRGLPPAYGDLDDEDRYPPYSRHQDGGTIEIAHIKREIRRNFDRATDAALARTTATGNSTAFCDLTLALHNACHGLKELLKAAPDVQAGRFRKVVLSPGFPPAPGKVPLDILGSPPAIQPGTLIQQTNTAPYVGDRIAKLIIDLLWRTVSACNLRPTLYVESPEESSLLAVRHQRVDTTLTTALQLAFAKKRPLAQLQYFLSQLETLRVQLKGLSADLLRYEFFQNATAWLSEQIEKERELAASVSPPSFKEIPEAEDEEDDGVSSRWQGSDASGGKGDD